MNGWQGLVILSQLEQEYLLRTIESARGMADLRGFFLWTQGQFQALLPHRIMVCLQYDAGGDVVRSECLHGTLLAPALAQRLTDPQGGLAARLARQARADGQLPAMLAVGQDASGHRLAPFQAELQQLGLENVLLHATGLLPGGASCFVLFDLPQQPGRRHAYFMELLLPYLHIGLHSLPPAAAACAPGTTAMATSTALARPASLREREVLHWVREGKSNQEVGQILGISGYTVKNHLQRIYQVLGVSNRTQAVSRGIALRLLDLPPP